MALILDGTDGITSSGGTNVLQDDAVITANIADGAVSDAKIAAMAAAKLTGDVAAARITTALNAPGSALIFAARAWVNFNGIGTVAIRASGNVSSITDNGVGDYTVNFTTAMPDADYAWAGGAGNNNINGTAWVAAPANLARSTWKQTGLLRIGVSFQNTLLADVADVNVTIFR